MIAPPPNFPSTIFNAEQFQQPAQVYRPRVRDVRIELNPAATYILTYATMPDLFVLGGANLVTPPSTMPLISITLPPPTLKGVVITIVLITSRSVAGLLTVRCSAATNSFLNFGGTTVATRTLTTGGAVSLISTGTYWTVSC